MSTALMATALTNHMESAGVTTEQAAILTPATQSGPTIGLSGPAPQADGERRPTWADIPRTEGQSSRFGPRTTMWGTGPVGTRRGSPDDILRPATGTGVPQTQGMQFGGIASARGGQRARNVAALVGVPAPSVAQTLGQSQVK